MEQFPLGSLGTLNDYSSYLEALQDILKLSTTQIKKNVHPPRLLRQKVLTHSLLSVPEKLINWGEINPIYDGNDCFTLYEDEKIIAIHKPPFIHSHPLSYCESNNCLSFLRQKGMFHPLNVNKKCYDRGLIHRLDFETSGVLLLAKDNETHHALRTHWHEAAKEKNYWAIVRGDFPFDGEWEHFIESTGLKNHKMRVISNSREGQKGVLKIQKKDYLKNHNLSLLQIHLKTGIRHQIRVQLSSLGYPILGDSLYGGESAKRLFLHAFSYAVSWGELNLKINDHYAELFDQFFKLK